ncbi:transposase [Desulfosporosinus sp.]|uniref:transposase n=1 Tax=Desulfosporosinus sp. TaxID=157907 RepID=UPI0025C07A68|nr:transposase [Desulfosporosinus sp.]
MPRKAREQSPTGIYHVMMRGINRQSIFEEEKDRLKFIEKLAEFRDKNSMWAFVSGTI